MVCGEGVISRILSRKLNPWGKSIVMEDKQTDGKEFGEATAYLELNGF